MDLSHLIYKVNINLNNILIFERKYYMNIEIRKLTPELAEDYVHFFDITPHDENIDEHKCYCVCWCSAKDCVESEFSTREKRRNIALDFVKRGIIQGYVAYENEKIIGWCNANTKSDCLQCISWKRFMQAVKTDDVSSNIKVKSIYCFVIAPDFRRKGIATKLLEYVCEDAANDGFDYVEAYPNKEAKNLSSEFMGYSEMYSKSGFNVEYETEQEFVMRKHLK